MKMELLVKKITADAIVPVKAHPTDSGFDLFANEDAIIAPGETVVVKTGIAIQLPAGHEAQVRPKSGITSKTKLRVQLGTVDEPYRGEIGVIIDNASQCFGMETHKATLSEPSKAPNTTYLIRKHDKIAQLVIAPVAHPIVSVVEDLNNTNRGEGGFGSTGVRA